MAISPEKWNQRKRDPFDLDNYQLKSFQWHSPFATAVHDGVKCVRQWNEFALNIDAGEHANITNPFPSSSNWEELLIQACQAKVIKDSDRRNGYKRNFAADIKNLPSILFANSNFLVRSSHRWLLTHLSLNEIPDGRLARLLAKAIQHGDGPLKMLSVTACKFSVAFLSYIIHDDCCRNTQLSEFMFGETNEAALLMATKMLEKLESIKIVGVADASRRNIMETPPRAIVSFVGVVLRSREVDRCLVSRYIGRNWVVPGEYRQGLMALNQLEFVSYSRIWRPFCHWLFN